MGEILRRTARLFARPSFAEGVARVIDIGGTLNIYNRDVTEQEADAKALSSDWWAIGDDLRYSLQKHQEESKNPVRP